MQPNRFMPAEQMAEVLAFDPPEIEGPIIGHEGLSSEESRALTTREIAALRKQAWTDAFRQGLKEGHAEGRAKGLKDAQAVAGRLAGVIEQLAEPLADVDAGVVEAVSDLALLIARHVVRRELHTTPDEVVGVVRESLQHLPVSPRLARIRLHPEDVPLVEAALAPGNGDRHWRLEADPTLTRGGCVVETDVSRVDATVEARLAAIAARMLGGQRGGDHG